MLKKPAHLRLTNRVHKKSKRRGKVRFQSGTIPVGYNNNNDAMAHDDNGCGVNIILQVNRTVNDSVSVTSQILPLRKDMSIHEARVTIALATGISVKELILVTNRQDQTLLLNRGSATDGTLDDLGFREGETVTAFEIGIKNIDDLFPDLRGTPPSDAEATKEVRIQHLKTLLATVGTTVRDDAASASNSTHSVGDDAALASSITHSDEEHGDVVLCLSELQDMDPSDAAVATKEIRRQNDILLANCGSAACTTAGFVMVYLVSGNTSLAVSVSSTAPVAELKSHLSQMSEIGNPSPDEQCLLFNGILLQNDLSLFQQNIGNGDVMYLVKNECIQVIVSSDTTIALTVRPATTIASLKDAIFAVTSIVPDEQCLSFGTTLLWRDDRTLIEYNVGHNSTLNLKGRLRGGGVTQGKIASTIQSSSYFVS